MALRQTRIGIEAPLAQHRNRTVIVLMLLNFAAMVNASGGVSFALIRTIATPLRQLFGLQNQLRKFVWGNRLTEVISLHLVAFQQP